MDLHTFMIHDCSSSSSLFIIVYVLVHHLVHHLVHPLVHNYRVHDLVRTLDLLDVLVHINTCLYVLDSNTIDKTESLMNMFLNILLVACIDYIFGIGRSLLCLCSCSYSIHLIDHWVGDSRCLGVVPIQ